MKKCFIRIEFWDKNHEYHYRSMITSFRKAFKLFKQIRKKADGKEVTILFQEINEENQEQLRREDK